MKPPTIIEEEEEGYDENEEIPLNENMEQNFDYSLLEQLIEMEHQKIFDCEWEEEEDMDVEITEPSDETETEYKDDMLVS